MAEAIPSQESSENISTLEIVQEMADRVNSRTQDKGLKSINPQTGRQYEEDWIPEEFALLMIAESMRPEDEKANIAFVKYFQPNGDKTWYFSELSKDLTTFYGLYTDSRGSEYSYASLLELRKTYCGMGLWIERDIYFKPRPMGEIKND